MLNTLGSDYQLGNYKLVLDFPKSIKGHEKFFLFLDKTSI